MRRWRLTVLLASSCSVMTALDGLHNPIDGGSDATNNADSGVDAPPSVDGSAPVDGSYAAVVLASKPVSYLRLGDKTEFSAKDEVAAPSSYVGAVTVGVDGAIANDLDTAAKFGGGHVNLGVARFDFGPLPFTVELWANVPTGTDGGATPSIFRVGQAGLNGFGISYTSLGIEFYGYDALGTRCAVAAPFTSNSKYVHIVAVREQGNSIVYLNGVAGAQGACTFVTAEAGVASMVGAASGGFTYYGTVDEVSVYDRALPNAEVVSHYMAGVGQ